jgi:aminopeptidase N
MFKLSRLAVGACALLTACSVVASVQTSVCGHQRSLRTLFAEGLPPSLANLENPTDTDVTRYILDIEAVPSTSTIGGSVTIRAQSLINGLTQFHFRLRDNFTISAITLDTRPITFVRESVTTCRAEFDRAYNQNESFDLKITYSGVTVSRGFGSIEFGTHGASIPYVFTLSEPFYCYTWWPAKEENGDKALADIWVTVPSTISVVSNGLLTGTEVVAGGKMKYKWSTNYPIAPYLICFGATNFNSWTQTYSGLGFSMPVQFYVWPENDTPTNRAAWEKCLQMLATYKDIYGLYPFINEKYGIYQFVFSGGMEHQTITGQGTGSTTFNEGVTSHELGHQWWGDMVTCKTWSDIALNEGFATYTEALWLEKQPGSGGQPALTAAMASRKPTAHNESVYRTNVTDPNSIFSTNYAYRRGAWLLHQLRHIVGDTTFFNILAAYRNQYQYSSATWDDFAAVASSVYGQDLSWYFTKWVYGIGAPAYSYGYQNVVVNGKPYLLLSVNQTQQAGWGTFIFPIDVRGTVSGSPVTKSVWNDALAEYYVIPMTGTASGVTLDPDGWILTTAVTNVTYTPGPPKIIETSPAPGATANLGTQVVKITFHTPVNATAGAFTVVGDRYGSQAFSYSYDSGSNTAILTLAGALPKDNYTLTVSDTITAVNSGQRLDGEVANPNSITALPSGNGTALGSAIIKFKVAPVVSRPSFVGGN